MYGDQYRGGEQNSAAACMGAIGSSVRGQADAQKIRLPEVQSELDLLEKAIQVLNAEADMLINQLQPVRNPSAASDTEAGSARSGGCYVVCRTADARRGVEVVTERLRQARAELAI